MLRGSASAKIREHREHAAVVVGRRQEAELEEDRVDVRLDGLRAEEELLADRPVRAALRDQAEHLALPGRQLVERVVVAPAAEELRDDVGVDDGAAVRDAADGGEELVELDDPVLEQVAEALGAVAEERERVARLDDLREDEHPDLRMLGADRHRRLRPLVGVGRRHADVDDRDVGLLAPHDPLQRVGVTDLRDDLEAVLREDAGDALPRAGRSRRRSRPARKLPDHACPAAGRALDPQAAAVRLDAVAEPAQARAVAVHRRPADSVVDHLDDERAVATAALIVTEVASACLTAFASASHATK